MNTYSVSFTLLTVANVLLGTAVLMIASWRRIPSPISSIHRQAKSLTFSFSRSPGLAELFLRRLAPGWALLPTSLPPLSSTPWLAL